MANRGEPARLCRAAALDELVDGFGEDVVVHARLVAGFAAEQRVDGDGEVLASDVPQGDVDRAQRTHDGCAAEVGGSVQVLPVVLDAQRILTDEVVGELVDDLFGGLEVGPGADLAETDDAVVGVDLDEEVAIDGDGFDARYAHSGSKGTQGRRCARSGESGPSRREIGPSHAGNGPSHGGSGPSHRREWTPHAAKRTVT